MKHPIDWRFLAAKIVLCSVVCAFFSAAFVYGTVMAIRAVPIIGYLPFAMCCLPLGFALIWGARLWMAISEWRERDSWICYDTQAGDAALRVKP